MENAKVRKLHIRRSGIIGAKRLRHKSPSSAPLQWEAEHFEPIPL